MSDYIKIDERKYWLKCLVNDILGDDGLCEGCKYVDHGSCYKCRRTGANEIIKIIDADVASVRRAHWIQEEYWSEGIGMGESYGHYYKCSACGERVKLHDMYLDDYCRKCGAEMYEAKECERKRQEFDAMLAARNKEWRCY